MVGNRCHRHSSTNQTDAALSSLADGIWAIDKGVDLERRRRWQLRHLYCSQSLDCENAHPTRRATRMAPTQPAIARIAASGTCWRFQGNPGPDSTKAVRNAHQTPDAMRASVLQTGDSDGSSYGAQLQSQQEQIESVDRAIEDEKRLALAFEGAVQSHRPTKPRIVKGA